MLFKERNRHRYYKAMPHQSAAGEYSPILRPSLARFRTSWSSTNSNSSTITVDNDQQQKTKFDVKEQPRSRPHQSPVKIAKKRVTFSESIEAQSSKRYLYEDDLDKLWYTDDEMDDFWQDFMDTTDRLRERQKAWVKSIQKTFDVLSDAFTTPQDILQLVQDESVLSIRRIERLGMERHMIDPDERQEKKRHVRERVLYWQHAADQLMPAHADRADLMRTASHNLSRPFVVLAYLIAERSARLEA